MAVPASWSKEALPIPRTRLIGRESERASARSLLPDEAVSLLTVTSPRGATGRSATGWSWLLNWVVRRLILERLWIYSVSVGECLRHRIEFVVAGNVIAC